MIFYRKQIILGDVRSTFSYLRRIFNNKNTIFISDGLGTEVAKIIFKRSRRLYHSYSGLPFYKIILDYITFAQPEFMISQKKVSNTKKTKINYFIGQPLTENKIVNIEDEINKIKSSKPDFYIVHPSDSKLKLEIISESIKILKLNIPAEEFLYKNGFGKLIGFSSSVLFNFRDENIEILNIKYKNNWLGEDCYFAYKILKDYLC